MEFGYIDAYLEFVAYLGASGKEEVGQIYIVCCERKAVGNTTSIDSSIDLGAERVGRVLGLLLSTLAATGIAGYSFGTLGWAVHGEEFTQGQRLVSHAGLLVLFGVVWFINIRGKTLLPQPTWTTRRCVQLAQTTFGRRYRCTACLLGVGMSQWRWD